MDAPFVLVPLLVVGAGIVIVAMFVWRAPAGYQDNRGFHLGHGGEESKPTDRK